MRSVSLSIPPGLRTGKPLGPVPSNIRSAKQDFVGIGIALVRTKAGTNAVMQVWPGSPAEIAGIRRNDVMHSIDNVCVVDAPIETLQDALRGPGGSTVNVSVLREQVVYDIGPIKRHECQSVRSLGENIAQLRKICSEQRHTGLDEVLSKLNQTSIEMDRERRVYREELLKSYSNEQNAIFKLQHLSDLLLDKINHQNEIQQSMHARIHEIAHMNQEVFQSFEDIQLEIKSLQDDFKSINEWSQTSGNKIRRFASEDESTMDWKRKNIFPFSFRKKNSQSGGTENLMRENMINLLKDHNKLISHPFSRVKKLSDQLQTAKMLLGKSQDLLKGCTKDNAENLENVSPCQSSDVLCNHRQKISCFDDSSSEKQNSSSDQRISRQCGVFSTPMEAETSYTMASKRVDQCRISCGSFNLIGRIYFNGRVSRVNGIARRVDCILSNPQIDLEEINDCIIIIDQRSENFASHARRAILAGATSIVIIDDGNLDHEVIATISRTIPIITVAVAEGEMLPDGSEISIQCSPRGNDNTYHSSNTILKYVSNHCSASLCSQDITDEHCSIDRLSLAGKKHEDIPACTCYEYAGNSYAGGMIQTKTKRYDSGQVASLKDAHNDLDNFQHRSTRSHLSSRKDRSSKVKEALYQQALEQVGPVDLPLGWSMRMSRSRNQVFYYNKETREKRWTVPELPERHHLQQTPPIAPQSCPCAQPNSPLSIATQMQLGIADEISLCAESSVAGDLTRCESGISPTLDAYASDSGMEMKIPPWPQDLISAMNALARIFVGGRQIVCTRAEFGMQVHPQFSNMIIKGKIVRTQPWLANGALENVDEIKGCIAIIGRGGCPFTEKARRAEEAGAKAVVIVNHADFLFNVLGKVSNINIPVVSITKSDGDSLQNGMSAVLQWGENPKKALEDSKNMEVKELAEKEEFPYSFRLTSQLVEAKDMVTERRSEYVNLTVI